MVEKIILYGRMVRFGHTVFALPFALSAVILAQRRVVLRLSDLFWILVAMVAARSAAMGFNRLADARLDAANPRTSGREIPAGRLSVASTERFILLFSALFLASAAMLGQVCFYLSLPVLALLFSYSYAKRFTWLSHLYLGFVISLAPAAAWIAVTKTFSVSILWLSGALMTWMAGFDILYACQDLEFDRRQGLFSIPSRFGVKNALIIASICHGVSMAAFLTVYFVFDMSIAYLVTVLIIGILLFIENRMVRPDDLTRVPIAFFHINSVISVTLLAGVFTDEMLRNFQLV